MSVTIGADLHVEIDGVSGHLVSEGDALVLRSPRPVALVLAATRGQHRPDPGRVRQLRRLHARLGQPLILRGPRGDLLRIPPPSTRPTGHVSTRWSARRLAAVAVAAAALATLLHRARR